MEQLLMHGSLATKMLRFWLDVRFVNRQEVKPSVPKG
jgi:hypothetical protein